jgi:hypothetical protein
VFRLEIRAMQRQLGQLAAMAIGTLGLTLINVTVPVMAQTCASQCDSKPIQFQPGQRIEVTVYNRTRSVIMMENTQGDRAVALKPGEKIKFYRGGSTDPNLAVAFWEDTATPLKLGLVKPKANQLEINLTFARQAPGDRALYILNDGAIQLL